MKHIERLLEPWKKIKSIAEAISLDPLLQDAIEEEVHDVNLGVLVFLSHKTDHAPLKKMILTAGLRGLTHAPADIVERVERLSWAKSTKVEKVIELCYEAENFMKVSSLISKKSRTKNTSETLSVLDIETVTVCCLEDLKTILMEQQTAAIITSDTGNVCVVCRSHSTDEWLVYFPLYPITSLQSEERKFDSRMYKIPEFCLLCSVTPTQFLYSSCDILILSPNAEMMQEHSTFETCLQECQMDLLTKTGKMASCGLLTR
ncbi:MAG: hypothetical protein JSS82_13995 [Bacteroidetes bacterium]|nr:hypothetical protein [Bacteroidota bacterium]